MEDNWLPDDSDAVDLTAMPKPKSFKPKTEPSSEVNLGMSLTAITGSENERSVDVEDAPRYSFGNKPTGNITGGVDDEPKKYKNSKNSKTYPKKVYKKKVERDWDENPVASQEERLRLLKSAEGTAVWHLARRDMTVKMVRDKLKAKNKYPKDIIEEIIQKCLDNNWINDERFAENFTRSKQEYGKLGKNAIKRELMLKGVDSETASEAISGIDSEDEREAAMQLVLKQLPRTVNLEKQKRINRILGMLARKGYPSDIAFSVIREAIDAEIIDEE